MNDLFLRRVFEKLIVYSLFYVLLIFRIDWKFFLINRRNNVEKCNEKKKEERKRIPFSRNIQWERKAVERFGKVGQRTTQQARGKFCKSHCALVRDHFASRRSSQSRVKVADEELQVSVNRLVRSWFVRFIVTQWKGKM